jgi:hypothetical protein
MIERTANQCGKCDRLQEPPLNPDTLLESEPVHRPAMPSTLADLTLPARAEAGRSAPARAEEPAAERKHEQTQSPTMQWHPDPEILSAKELAAAFKLDFNPRTPRTGARLGRTALTLVVLGAITASVMLYLRPDERERLSAIFHGTPQPGTENAQRAQEIPSMPTSMPLSRSSEPLMPPATPPDIAAASSTPQQARAVESPDSTIHVREAPPIRADVGALHADMAAVSTTAATSQPSASITPTETRTQLSEAEALTQARSLWSKAIDAEARHDYSGAVELYEKIHKLPRSVWPASLNLRLEAAKKQPH